MPDIQVESPLVPRFDDIPQPQQANGAGGEPQPKPEPQPPPPPPPQRDPQTPPQSEPEPEPQVKEAREQQPPPPIQWKNGKIAIPLRKKVQAHGDTLEWLVMREPTGADIERIGQPVVLNVLEFPPRPVYDTAVMAAMLSHLAAVPPSTIRGMDPRDWQNCALALVHFFLPDRWISQ